MSDKKTKVIKNLLATASAVAVLTTGASNAMANANVSTTGNVAALQDGNGNALSANFNNGVGIRYDANGRTITTGADVTIGVIDINNKAPGVFTASHNVILGSVGTTAGGAGTVNFKVGAANKTLTFSGTPGVNQGIDLTAINACTYTGFGNIDVDNKANTTIVVDTSTNVTSNAVGGQANGGGGAITLRGTIANLNNGGTLQVKTDLVTTSRTWAAIKDIQIGRAAAGANPAAAANLTLDAANNAGVALMQVAASSVDFLHEDSKLILKTTGGVGGFTLHQNLVAKNGTPNTVDNHGKVEIDSTGGAFTLASNAAETLGESEQKRLKELKVSGTAAVTVAKKVFAKNIDINLANNKAATFTSGFNAGADGQVIITNANTTKVVVTGDSKTGLFDFNAKDKLLEIGSALIDADFTGNINAKATGKGAVAKAGTVSFLGDSDYTGEMKDIKLVTVADNKTLTLKSNPDANVNVFNNTISDLQLSGANSVLTFENNVNIGATVAGNDGHINEAAGAGGTINFLGNSTIAGNVGTTPFGTMNVQGSAGQAVTIGGDITGATINFKTNNGGKLKAGGDVTAALVFLKDGTLSFNSDADHTLTGASTTTAPNADGIGTITVDAGVGAAAARTVTLNGDIGDVTNNNKGLKLLDLQSAQNLTVVLQGGDAHIKKARIAGEGTVIQLNEAGATYRIGDLDTDEEFKGVLEVAQNVTLQSNTLAADIDLAVLSAAGGFKKFKFVDGTTATIADGSAMVAETLDNNANNGVLAFSGDAVFYAAPGANAIASIASNGAAGKTVKYLTSIKSQGNITTANASTFAFYGDKMEAPGFVGAAGTKLILTGAGNQEVAAVVNNQTAVEFAGGAEREVKFSLASSAPSYTFTNTKAIIVDLSTNSNVDNANFTVSNDVDNNLVKVRAGTNLRGNLGGEKTLSFESAGDLTVTSNKAGSKNAQFFTSADDKVLNLESSDATSTIKAISKSSNDKIFKDVNFKKNYTVLGDSEAKNFNIADDRSVTFSGDLTGEKLNLNGQNAKVSFDKDNLDLNIAILSSSNNFGEVTFGDINVNILESIGANGTRVGKVMFTSDSANAKRDEWKYAVLQDDIHAAEVSFKKQTVYTFTDLTIDGNLKFAGSNLELLDNKLTSTGGDTEFSGNIVITSDYVSQDKSGRIVNATGAVKFAQNSTLKIEVEDRSGRIARADASITILDNKGQDFDDNTKALLSSLTKDSISVVGANDLVEWIPKIDGKSFVLVRNNIAGQKISADIIAKLGAGDSSAEVENIKLFDKAPAGTAAGNVYDSLVAMSPDKRTETIQRITRESATQSSINQVGETVASVISGRLFNAVPAMGGVGEVITPNMSAAVASNDAIITGVAAGDDADRYGVWGSPFMSESTQKERKKASGYKAESFGGTAGFDVKANDDLVIGGAFTYSNTDVKHKDSKKGDKTKVDSYLFSIYGMQQLTTNWFLQGVATVGNNSVKNESVRVVSNTQNETAKSSYSSMLLSGELMAGYNHHISALTVTPMMGLGLTRVNDAGYRESGTTNQNLDINKKASNKFEVIAGMRLSAQTYDMDGVTMTPDIHGFINHDLIGKNPDIDVKMDGLASNLSQQKVKPARTFYTVGAGLNSSYSNMEYGISYDAQLGEKYISHQGSLKLRVNF